MRQILLLGVALFTMLYAHAQNYGSLLSYKIQSSKKGHTEFATLSLFSDLGVQSNNFADKYRLYQPNQFAITKLYTQKPIAVSITLISANGKPYTIELLESHPTSADAQIDYVDESGKHRSTVETGLHYQGIVKGEVKSLAAMSVFSNGDVMILFSCNDGNFNMGKLGDNSGKYILYNSNSRLQETPFTCASPDTGTINLNGRAANKTTGAILCKKLRVHWEVDYTLYQSKGSTSAVQNYLTGLFNFMQSIYYNEGMAVELSSLKIWAVDDPFTTTNAWDASWQFGRYWQSQQHTYYGEQPHLIADFNGWQGYANIGAICFPNGYACSNILGQQSATYPTFDVDVYVVAHETGHTVGSQHTQSCSWKTGPGGTCGSVDNCVTQEGGAGCSTCFYLHDANATNFKGTIMSYCGGKINFSEGFGSIVGDFLRTEFNKHTCFDGVVSADLITGDICDNDGSIKISYPTNNFGVAPYVYSWSSGQKTKDINSLAVAGQYTVTILDSNNCSLSATATVDNYPKPGDGIPLTGTMPYCCKDTSFDVTIKAFVPTHLKSCQTVSWLRTTTPLTSYNDALVAYNNATSSDILLSDNDTSINNTTAAELTISSPSPCSTVTTYYYTPFVSLKATQKKSYNTNAINPVTIKNGTFSLGTSMTIPATTNPPSTCEQKAMVTDTVTVSISNYTGRSNHLTIRIIAADNKELYQNITLAGNGTYQIPITGVEDHHQEMTVKAFDFNCSGGSTCTNSSLSISAVRTITYEPIKALTIDSSCIVGKSVLLSFGPDSCDKLAVHNITNSNDNITLYPNPATGYTTLEFTATGNGTADISIADVSGRTIFANIKAKYHSGTNKTPINIKDYQPGIYFVSLNVNNTTIKQLKLVIQ